MACARALRAPTPTQPTRPPPALTRHALVEGAQDGAPPHNDGTHGHHRLDPGVSERLRNPSKSGRPSAAVGAGRQQRDEHEKHHDSQVL